MNNKNYRHFKIICQMDKTWSYLYVGQEGRRNIVAPSVDELKQKVLAKGYPWNYNPKDFEKKEPIPYEPQITINRPTYQKRHDYDTTQLYKCPNCGDLLYLKDREDGSGEFYQCERCNNIYNYEYVQSFSKYTGPESKLEECPRCGSSIVSKVGGPRGNFFGCEEFPLCEFAYSELLRLKDTPKQDIIKNEEEIDRRKIIVID